LSASEERQQGKNELDRAERAIVSALADALVAQYERKADMEQLAA
jgi:hypothetical protein